MIEIRNLSKTYPGNREPTLRGITLHLTVPGLYFLVGKSGAGKSTFLSLVGGMDFAYEGSLKVDGKELKSLTEKEREDYRFAKVAFVFQDGKAEEEETLFENLLKPLDITTLNVQEKKERIQHVLSRLGLSRRMKSPFKSLSGGERKRVALARALIRDCPLLLLDEPMASLDYRMRQKVLSLLQEEARRRLVLVITHEEKEIPKDATILSLSDGRITLRQKEPSLPKRETSLRYKRKKFSGLPFLRSLFHSLKARRGFLLLALTSLVVSLFSISFSFLLSGSVKEAMASALSHYMDKGAMVVERREEETTGTGYEIAGYNDLLKIKRAFPEDVLAVSPFYLSSLNSIFQNDQSLRLCYQNRFLSVSSLSLDSFLHHRLVEECEEGDEIEIDTREMTHEEIILCLDEEILLSLYLLLFHEEAIYGVTDEVLENIRRKVWYQGLTLEIKADMGEWSYHLDHSYEVVDVLFSQSVSIVSPYPDFGEYFVSKTMQFVEVMEGEKAEVPWQVSKTFGLRLYPLHGGDFLRRFLRQEEFDSYTIGMLREKGYYLSEKEETHNHVQVYIDYLPKISISKTEEFLERNLSFIKGVSYSSPIYTYTASGFVSGFQKPFFFSREKEKLNVIMDQAYRMDENLGAFQGSLIEVEEGVIKADLLSAMDEDGLRFRSLDHATIAPAYGKKPESIREIALSTAMAKKLFGDISKAVGEKLHCLTLDKTVADGNGYRNIFSEGFLTISGIYEDEEQAIYHESLFPLCYAFAHTSLGPEDLRITQAVIDVDLERKDADSIVLALEEGGEYRASFPMLLMTEEISSLLDGLSFLFLGFALFSLVTASFLLFLSLYLIVHRDRKTIGILLSLGYSKKEIGYYYGAMVFLVGFLSFVGSLFLSLFAEKTIRNTLTGMLTQYGIDILPYAISFLTMVLTCLILSLILFLSIRKLSPKDAFLK